MKNHSWASGSILFIVFVLGIGISCNKDESSVPLPVSRAQLLARSWIQTDLLASLPGGSPTSVFTTVLQPCERDNIWNFKSDGTYTVTEGATKCNAADPDTATSGTWQLTDSDTKIIIDDINDVPQTFTITELTSSSLKITGTTVVQGSSVTGTAIFSPQ